MKDRLLHVSFATLFGTSLGFCIDKSAENLKNHFISEIQTWHMCIL